MKCKTVIDPTRDEEVILYVHERNDLCQRIEQLVAESPHEWVGYRGREIVMLRPCDVVCFTVEDGKVYALTDSERLRVMERLYMIEQNLDSDFVKINQSCIANIKKIDRFEASFAGALLVRFQNGHSDYVSRRQLKTVKERIGFRL